MNINGINRFVQNGLLSTHTLGLMGNHGVGKTSYVHNTLRSLIAQKHKVPLEKVHVISRCVSIMDPADLIGNFQEFGGRTYNCPPSWIPTCKEYDDEMAKLYEENGMHYSRLTQYDDIYILFLDECKRGNSVIQDAIMELLLEHRLFGVNLKENTYVVCADNDNAKIYNGSRRDPAQESRIKNFTFAPSNKEYLEDYTHRVEQESIHSAILEFLAKYPDMIVLPSKTIEELSIQGKKGPCPRDWTQLGECLKEFEKNGDDITNQGQSYLTEIAAGFIGSTYALKFAQFCTEERKNSLDPEEILNKWNARLKKKVVEIFKASPMTAVPICDSMLQHIMKIELSEKQEKNIVEYLEVCPNEAIVNFTSTWQKEKRDQFLKWRCTPKRHNVCNKAIMADKATNGAKSPYENWIGIFTKRYKLDIKDMNRDDIKLEA